MAGHMWIFVGETLQKHPDGAWLCTRCAHMIDPPLVGHPERYGPCAADTESNAPPGPAKLYSPDKRKLS